MSDITTVRQALDSRPDDPLLHCELAGLLHNAGRGAEAAEHFQRAIELDPTFRRAWYNLGCVWNELGCEADAIPCFRRSLELEPAHAPSHHNLGQSLFNLGDTDGAIEQYRQAIALGAGSLSETMLAMTIAVSPSADPQTILQMRRRWAEQYLPRPLWNRQPQGRPNESGPRRRTRIGYVSAYFDHPNWMKPVWALVNRHDRQRFELFLYSDGQPQHSPAGYRPDARDGWHWTGSLGNLEMAQLIAEHELDLLVDLNGFSRLPRLGVFALQPAPRQVGWFNMFATTGMAEFDYLIGDETVVRPGEESDYCERIVRVGGCYLTFEVTYPVPEVAPLPSQSSGRFTFGSLASLYKITPGVVELWTRILRQCPESRLLLRNSGLRSAANREHLRERFAVGGIAPERLRFDEPAEHFEFLRTYDQIDLALDTFPYNGGTTTSEALWQGVPVMAIHGDRWTSRVSSSLLKSAGLSEFIAPDAEGYVSLAAALANDRASRERLAQLRLTLRDRLRDSHVCDVDGFARRMEDIYRTLVQS